MSKEVGNQTLEAGEHDEGAEAEHYLSFTQAGIKKYREVQKESTQKFLVWLLAGSVAGLVTSGYLGTYLDSKVNNKQKLRNYKIMSFLLMVGGISYHGSKLARRDFFRGRKQIENNPDYCSKIDRDTAKRLMQERGQLK